MEKTLSTSSSRALIQFVVGSSQFSICLGCLVLILEETSPLLWLNTVKSLVAEIWFERNQRVFMVNPLNGWDCFEVAHKNASS